ncbi:MAG: hypothetical protein R2704_02475 [Microthrixaceae bacterium]
MLKHAPMQVVQVCSSDGRADIAPGVSGGTIAPWFWASTRT